MLISAKVFLLFGRRKKKRHGKARIEINRSFTFLVWVTHVRLSRLSLAGPPLLMPCIIATTCFGSSSLIFTLIIPLFLRFAFVLSFSFGCKRICRERKKKILFQFVFYFIFWGRHGFFFFFGHMKTWLLITALKECFWSWNILEFFNGIFFPSVRN